MCQRDNTVVLLHVTFLPNPVQKLLPDNPSPYYGPLNSSWLLLHYTNPIKLCLVRDNPIHINCIHLFYIHCMSRHVYSSTCVWAQRPLSCKRPPAVYAHVINVQTCVTRPRTVIYWLSAPAITDSANIYMPRFLWSLQPTIAGTNPNLRAIVRSNFRDVVWWPTNNNFMSSKVVNHVIAATRPLHWFLFRLPHHVVKVTSSVFQPAMSKKRTILSLDQRIEVLRRLDEAYHVERLLPGQCGKTQMARIEANTTLGSTPTAYS